LEIRCQRCSRSDPDPTNVEDLRRVRLLLDQLWLRTAMGAQRWSTDADLSEISSLRNELLEATHRALRVCTHCGATVCGECWDAERGRCLSCVAVDRRPATIARGADAPRIGAVPRPTPARWLTARQVRQPVEPRVTRLDVPTTADRLIRAMRQLMTGWRGYRFMRRIVLPAVVVVGLAALTIVGLSFMSEMLQGPGPARAEGGTVLMTETFDRLALQASVPGGWRIVGGSGRLSVAAVPSRSNKSGRLVATGSSGSAVACRSLPGAVGTTLTVNLALRLDGAQPRDLLLVEVGAGARPLAAALGVDRAGRIMFLDGGSEVSVIRTLSANTWYQVSFGIHMASKTYDVQLVAADGSVVFRSMDVRWNPGARTGTTSICLTAPSGPGSSLYFDNLEVRS
jgi:hypothetical protein